MPLTSIPVPRVLESHVECIYHFDGFDSERRQFFTLADKRSGLFIQNPQKGIVTTNGRSLPSSFLCGPSLRHSITGIEGNFDALAIVFRPEGLHESFNFHVADFTNRYENFDLIFPGFSESVFNYASFAEQLNYVLSFLTRSALEDTRRVHGDVTCAVNMINIAKGKITVGQLINAVKVSERTLLRKFNEQVGMSPKAFIRVTRFNHILADLISNQDDVAGLSYAYGYADQSHMIRDFRNFAGFTPGEITRLANAFI